MHCIRFVDCCLFASFPFLLLCHFFMHHGHCFHCSFVAFSTAQRTSCGVSSWQIRIAPDHLCRDATDPSLVDKLSQRAKTCRFFLCGVGPCKHRSCTPRICHILSFDLSGRWTSLDLIWWVEWRIKLHPWCRALGPVIGFHQHLHRHLHQPYHIQCHLVLLPLHAHLLCHVHQHNHAPQALQVQSLRLSLVHLRLLNLPHPEVQNTTTLPVPTGLISILAPHPPL